MREINCNWRIGNDTSSAVHARAIYAPLNTKGGRDTSIHAIRWPQPSNRWKMDVPRKDSSNLIWSTPMQMPSGRKMRLTSRDEGGGRGGGGKEEEGGVDELHFYLGLGVELDYQLLRL